MEGHMREKIFLVRQIAAALGYGNDVGKHKEVELAMHFTKESLKLILRRAYEKNTATQ
jgi:hypothetical protein